MSKIQFRVAAVAVADAEDIARVVNAAYRPAPGKGGWTHESDIVSGARTSPSQVKGLLATSAVIVGVLDSAVIACAHVESHAGEAHIGMLAVEPTLQASGVGKELLAYAERYAAEVLGATDLVLVVVRARTELIAFYLRRGYQRTGSLVEYPIEAGVGTPISAVLELEILRKRCSNNSLQARRL